MNAYDEDLQSPHIEPIRRSANQFSYSRRSRGRRTTGMHRRRRHHWRPASKAALAVFSAT